MPACGVYAWLAWRTWQTYLLTRRPSDAAVAVGLVWLGTSIPTYLLSPVWSWTFWAGHGLEASGFLAVASAVTRDLTRRTPTFALRRRTRAQDLLDSESELLGGYVKSLKADLHDHDPSTLVHSQNVADAGGRRRRAALAAGARPCAGWRSPACSTTSASCASRRRS